MTSSRPWTNFLLPDRPPRGPYRYEYLQRWFERLAHQTDDLVNHHAIRPRHCRRCRNPPRTTAPSLTGGGGNHHVDPRQRRRAEPRRRQGARAAEERALSPSTAPRCQSAPGALHHPHPKPERRSTRADEMTPSAKLRQQSSVSQQRGGRSTTSPTPMLYECLSSGLDARLAAGRGPVMRTSAYLFDVPDNCSLCRHPVRPPWRVTAP